MTDINSLSDDEKKIITLLEKQDDYLYTTIIAKELFGAKAKPSAVNPTLYKLLSKKLVKKKSEESGAKPRWKLRKSGKSGKSSNIKNVEDEKQQSNSEENKTS